MLKNPEPGDTVSPALLFNHVARDMAVRDKLDPLQAVRMYTILSATQVQCVASTTNKPTELVRVAYASAHALSLLSPEDGKDLGKLRDKYIEDHMLTSEATPLTIGIAKGI